MQFARVQVELKYAEVNDTGERTRCLHGGSSRRLSLYLPGLLLMVLTACGGGGRSPAPMTASTPMTPSTYMIGGTVTGLTGLGLVLQNN